MASEVLKIDLKASDSTGAAFAALQRNSLNTSKMFSTFQGVVKGSLGLLAAGSLGEAIGAVREYADAWTMMQNRLKSAGLASGEAAVAQAKIVDIATKSRSSLAEVGNLYARVAFATEALGTSQADVAKITETLSKAFKLSGKTALESQSAITQLTQALASGVLQGDELRSLRENAPEVARAIADAFGVTVGELKKLGADGQLTADKIIPAILGASDKIEQRFAQTRSTFEDYGIAISNFFQRAVASVQDFVFASNESVMAMKNVAEQEKLLREAGRGARPVETTEDPVKKAMDDRKKMYDEEIQNIQKLNDELTKMARNFQTNQTVTQKGQTRIEVITPAQFNLMRDAFAEFKKTQKASDDFIELKLRIEEAAAGAVNFKAIEGLTALITKMAEATAKAAQLRAELHGASTMPMGQLRPVTPQFDTSATVDRYNIEGRLIEQTQATNAYVTALYGQASMSDIVSRTEQILSDAKSKGISVTYESALATAKYEKTIKDASKSGEDQAKTLEKLKEKYENVADPLKKFNDDLAEVEMLYKKGAIGANTYSNAVANINKAKQDFIEKSDPMKDQLKELERAFDGFGKKSADAIAEFVVSGKMDFRDLIQTMIKEMISMMIYQNLLKGMFTGGGGGFNFFSLLGLGGGIGSRTTIAGGALGGLRANGGPVSANRQYIVGEKGPELFMSGSSGSIVPNNRLGGGSDGVTINQTINISTGVQQTVRAEIQQLLPQISNAAKNAILDTKRRGGQFANAFGG